MSWVISSKASKRSHEGTVKYSSTSGSPVLSLKDITSGSCFATDGYAWAALIISQNLPISRNKPPRSPVPNDRGGAGRILSNRCQYPKFRTKKEQRGMRKMLIV